LVASPPPAVLSQLLGAAATCGVRSEPSQKQSYFDCLQVGSWFHGFVGGLIRSLMGA
jgi:hypothetical protein